MRWQDAHDLVHYTKSPDIVGAILRNGFMLVPNRRNLANRLLGDDGLFKVREPQQFGMISFTELPRRDTLVHRETFGDFGIVVRWEWAVQHDAQRVLYVGDEGSVVDSLSWLFKRARQELEGNSREKHEAYLANKAIAGLYSQMYHHLLTLYEFMEPDRNSSQVEWRIVNKIPYHHRNIADRDAMMAELLRHASQGAGTIKVRPADVEALVCPIGRVLELRAAMPKEFAEVPVLPIAGKRSISAVWRTCIASLQAMTRRGPRVIMQPPPVEGAPIITKSFAGMFALPTMKKLHGVAFYPDEVLELAHCEVQYQSEGGDTLDLRMPFVQAMRLLGYLQASVDNPKVQALMAVAIRREKAAMAKREEGQGKEEPKGAAPDA